MAYLAGLTWGRRALAVADALDAAGARAYETVHVLGSTRLARALQRRGRDARAASSTEIVSAAADSLAALVAVGNAEPDPEWQRALRAGGALVLVSTLAPTEMSRRALCAGLVDLEQRRAGRYVVLSGRAWKPRLGSTG